MDEREMRLDGNAAAGMLSELFADEVTSAKSACASCGAIADVGAQHLYMYHLAPGAVVRCHRCESVMMVLARRGGRVRFGLPGISWLEVYSPNVL